MMKPYPCKDKPVELLEYLAEHLEQITMCFSCEYGPEKPDAHFLPSLQEPGCEENIGVHGITDQHEQGCNGSQR